MQQQMAGHLSGARFGTFPISSGKINIATGWGGKRGRLNITIGAPSSSSQSSPLLMTMPDPDSLRATIKRLIVERLFIEGLDPVDISDDAPIGDELGLDSMDFLELAVGLEQEFGLQIVGKGLEPESLRNVDSLVEFVQQKLAEKEQSA